MDSNEAAAERPSRKLRGRRLFVRLAFVAIVTGALLEVGIRVMLFSEHPKVEQLARKLRAPGNFAHRWCSQYWKLQYMFSKHENRKPPPKVDPVLGWRSARLLEGGYLHEDLSNLGKDRPVLLYGDSFAQRTSRETTWPSLLESSPVGDGRRLINYGVGGYGLDQAFLLFILTVGQLSERDPIVVMSILVDDDLDRVHLSFRGWPKPFLKPDSNELDFANDLGPTSDEWLAEHPPEVTSYAWRYLVFGSNIFPASWRVKIGGRFDDWTQTKTACRRLLSRLDRELRERELDSFVLIFHGKGQLATGPTGDWREGFLTRELDRRGIPYVSTRTDFDADRAMEGRRLGDYIAERGEGKGHYTAVGNEVSYRALERGLRGQFDGQARQARRSFRDS